VPILPPSDVTTAANDLLGAEKSGRQIGLLSKRFAGMDMDDAYAVQRALVRQKQETASVTGWKIGLTSKAMQAALGIDIPDSGVLLQDMRFETGARIPRGRFIEPRIEAEIAFVFKAPLLGRVTREEVLNATDYVCPVIEILDTRICRKDPETGEPRKVVDTIADNAANAGYVLGHEKHDPSTDLRWVGAIVSKNGEVEETGLGAGVLNDPVTSVAWLSERMGHYGQRIEPGHVVLSGSFIRPVECPPGSSIEADFGVFGQVTIAFED